MARSFSTKRENLNSREEKSDPREIYSTHESQPLRKILNYEIKVLTHEKKKRPMRVCTPENKQPRRPTRARDPRNLADSCTYNHRNFCFSKKQVTKGVFRTLPNIYLGNCPPKQRHCVKHRNFRNSMETVSFYKTSALGNQVKFGILRSLNN